MNILRRKNAPLPKKERKEPNKWRVRTARQERIAKSLNTARARAQTARVRRRKLTPEELERIVAIRERGVEWQVPADLTIDNWSIQGNNRH